MRSHHVGRHSGSSLVAGHLIFRNKNVYGNILPAIEICFPHTEASTPKFYPRFGLILSLRDQYLLENIFQKAKSKEQSTSVYQSAAALKATVSHAHHEMKS